tara:strand:- start:4895 stop:5260 length:366 start_codon:yes stop_codon:yes gene_type:complete
MVKIKFNDEDTSFRKIYWEGHGNLLVRERYDKNRGKDGGISFGDNYDVYGFPREQKVISTSISGIKTFEVECDSVHIKDRKSCRRYLEGSLGSQAVGRVRFMDDGFWERIGKEASARRAVA